ncbi:MAG: ASCH domain-containing protein [Terriglobales bacterium]
MAGSPRVVLMSIHPEYAFRIADGTKRVELRVRPPALPTPYRVLFYGTTPLRKMVAWATVAKVLVGTPTEIWGVCGGLAAVNHDTFHHYLAHRKRLSALYLENVSAVDPPVSLPAAWRPPQSFRFLSREEAIMCPGGR